MLEQFRNMREMSVRRVVRAGIRRMQDLPHLVQWMLPNDEKKKNDAKLLRYKDKHQGEVCVIVANGPSLNQVDFSLLNGVATIGMNRIHLMEGRNGFKPTYHVVSDVEVQLKQFANEYESIGGTRFFNWNARRLFRDSDDLMFFKESFSQKFQPDFTKPIGTGKSVTFACLQLAYFMGFKEVVLIGKDHRYAAKGKPQDDVTSNGQEENHFVKGYYRPEMIWRVPDFRSEEYSYKLARIAYEANGCRIYDATIQGELQVFPKVDFYNYFGVKR